MREWYELLGTGTFSRAAELEKPVSIFRHTEVRQSV